MAKDPAINWYFDNWSGGTKGFTRHQKGCYMDLLESQFYLGPLSLEQIKNILGSDLNQWPNLKAKFQVDENGNFFNERLEQEKNKRKRYSESRSSNRKKKDVNYTSSSHDLHVLNTPGIETETGTGIRTEVEGMGEGGMYNADTPAPLFTIEHCATIALADNRWVQKNKANEESLKKFNDELIGQGVYHKNPLEYKKHYFHWSKKYNGNNNTTGAASKTSFGPRNYQPEGTGGY